jgi:hypothetical protein
MIANCIYSGSSPKRGGYPTALIRSSKIDGNNYWERLAYTFGDDDESDGRIVQATLGRYNVSSSEAPEAETFWIIAARIAPPGRGGGVDSADAGRTRHA